MKNYSAINVSQFDENRHNYNVFVPEIIPVIEKFNKGYSGGFYDHNVIPELQKMPQFANMDFDTLKHFAYVTNGYVSDRNEQAAKEEFERKLIADGFLKLGNPENYVGKKFLVVASFSSFLGTESQKIVPQPHFLIKDAANDYFFILRRNSRKGIRANENTFVKPI